MKAALEEWRHWLGEFRYTFVITISDHQMEENNFWFDMLRQDAERYFMLSLCQTRTPYQLPTLHFAPCTS